MSITDRWTICVFSGSVQRKLRYDCDYYCREKWGSKVYLENSYYFQGYWRILTEKFEEMMAKYKPGLYGDERWPFITHFVGCEFCEGAVNPEYSSELCISQMERAVNFADNQVLSLYGFKHPTLGANSVRPVARQATTSLFVSTYLPSSSPAPTSLRTLVGVLRTRSNGFSWELPGFIYIYVSTTADPTNKPIGNPKSSSVAKGRQGFHLHTSGFEPRTSFWGRRVPDMGYISEPDAPLAELPGFEVLGLSQGQWRKAPFWEPSRICDTHHKAFRPSGRFWKSLEGLEDSPFLPIG